MTPSEAIKFVIDDIPVDDGTRDALSEALQIVDAVMWVRQCRESGARNFNASSSALEADQLLAGLRLVETGRTRSDVPNVAGARRQLPAAELRHIADQKLERGSREWAAVHRISGYIEGMEEGLARVSKAGPI